MKPLRLLSALFALGLALAAGISARATELQAVLITASTEPGPTDPRLARYELTLKRVLRFNSYTYQGSDSAALTPKESTSLMIGQGHELFVEPSEKPLTLIVRWTEGGRTLMNTGLTLRLGIPAVLGGPATGNRPGEVYTVILVAR